MKRLLLGFIILSSLSITTWAAEYENRRYPRAEEHSTLPRYAIGEATDMVQRNTGGRVVGANPVNIQGRDAYRMKVLTPQGEVRIIHVNPATGRAE